MAIESPEADDRAAPVPGDGGLPVLGYTAQFVSGKLTISRERYDRYGPVSWIRVFGLKVVTAQGPDACGEVLQNRSHAFGSGPGWSFLIGPFFHRGLMLLDFDEHHLHRRIMQQAFTSERLAGYLEPMNATVADGLARWPAGDDFLVYPAIKQLTLDVATRTFMGAKLDADADRLNAAFVDCVRAGTAAVRFPVPGLRWARGLAGRKVLENFLYPQLPAKRAGVADDLFSALCHARGEGGEQFTDDDVVNHMIFLLMAAHDTITITITAIAYYLAKHPEWQERCRTESLALGMPTIRHDDLDKLVSLDLVMKEAMRLITPLPGVMQQDGPRHGTDGPFRREGHLRQRQPLRCPPPERVLAGSGPLRSGALRRRPSRGQGAPQRVDALRPRRPQVHRHVLRRHGDQGCAAPDVAGLPVERAGGLPAADRLVIAPPAQGRPAGPARTPLKRTWWQSEPTVVPDEGSLAVPTSNSLAGRTIIMSGGSRGIGLAIAVRAARDGANVAFIAKTDTPDPRLPGTIHTAAAEIEAAGGQALPILGDIRDDETVARAVAQTAEHFGGIDIVVNNASAITLQNVGDLPAKRYDLMLDINARGTFALTSLALPHLLESDNPHVLTLSPPLNMDRRWLRDHAPYTISKYAMTMLTLGVAESRRDAGVAANCLWPRTLIATAAVQNIVGGEGGMAGARDARDRGRRGPRDPRQAVPGMHRQHLRRR